MASEQQDEGPPESYLIPLSTVNFADRSQVSRQILQFSIDQLTEDTLRWFDSTLEAFARKDNREALESSAIALFDLKDCVDRFKIWTTADQAVFTQNQNSHAHLTSVIDQQVRVVLINIQEALSDLSLIATGSTHGGEGEENSEGLINASLDDIPISSSASTTPTSTTSSDENTCEIDVLLSLIQSAITNLLQLSGSRRFSRVVVLPKDSDRTYVRSLHSRIRGGFRNIHEDHWLVDRMLDATNWRLQNVLEPPPHMRPSHSDMGQDINQHERRKDFHKTSITTLGKEQSPPRIQSAASLSKLSESQGWRLHSFAMSYPDDPDGDFEDFENEPFRCIYCRTNVKMESIFQWYEHVYHDIWPYVCTFRDCEEVSIFQDLDTWMTHEQAHFAKHECFLCSVQVRSEAELQNHFADSHGLESQTPGVSLLLQSGLKTTRTCSYSCAFCSQLLGDAKHYGQHVSDHLRMIALSTLHLLPEDSASVTDKQKGNDMTGNESTSGHSKLAVAAVAGVAAHAHYMAAQGSKTSREGEAKGNAYIGPVFRGKQSSSSGQTVNVNSSRRRDPKCLMCNMNMVSTADSSICETCRRFA